MRTNTYLVSYRLDGVYFASKRRAETAAEAEANVRNNLSGRPEKATDIKVRPLRGGAG